MGREPEGAGIPLDELDAPGAGLIAIRGGAMRTVGYVSGIVLTLASVPLLLRYLGVVDFGRYTVAMSLVTLAGGVTEAGLTALALREYSVRTEAKREELMRQLLGLRLALTFGGVAVAVAIAWLAGYGEVLVLGTLLAGGGLVAQAVQSLLSVGLAARLRFGWVTIADLVRQLATVVLVILLVLAGAELLAFLAIPIPAGLLALALTVVVVRGLVPLRPAFNVSGWWSVLRDVLPFTAATAINVVYFRVAVIIVSLVASGTQTGYFATSHRILETLIGIPGLVVSAVFPMLARAARENRAYMAYIVGRTFEVAVIFGAWMALALIVGAEPIIDLLGGSDYRPVVPVLRIEALAVVATFVAVACQFPLFALHRNRELLIANGAALVSTVVLVAALAPAYGARGAAVATVLAETALAVAAVILLLREKDLSLPFRIVLPVLVAAAASASLGLVPGLPDLGAVALGTVLFFGLLLAFGRIPAEVLDAFRRLWGSSARYGR